MRHRRLNIKMAKHLITVVMIILSVLFGALLFVVFTTVQPITPRFRLNNIEQLTSFEFFTLVDQQFQRRFPGLFLETYTATYEFDSEGIPALTGQVYLRFAGWRKDWLGDLLTKHSIARLEIDIYQNEVTNFEYVHGDAFGFDAPLDLMTWPVNEEKLFSVCDHFGAADFKNTFHVNTVFVNATVNRPGRYWTATYNALPQYFNCMINIDSGEILVKNESVDWQIVGNLYELNN